VQESDALGEFRLGSRAAGRLEIHIPELLDRLGCGRKGEGENQHQCDRYDAHHSSFRA
jgi:hypothetical protein